MIRAVVGYALADDAIGLARFREKYAPLMSGEADRFAFETASKPGAVTSAEFAQIAKMAAGVDTLDGFLREMKTALPRRHRARAAAAGNGEGRTGPHRLAARNRRAEAGRRCALMRAALPLDRRRSNRQPAVKSNRPGEAVIMSKPAKTEAELIEMARAELKVHADCPDGIMISVLRDGDSWEFRARAEEATIAKPGYPECVAMLVQIRSLCSDAISSREVPLRSQRR